MGLSLLGGVLSACGEGDAKSWLLNRQPVIVVTSDLDAATPPEGVVTLRSAVADIESGGKIVFDPSLNGATIRLTIVSEAHSILKGEAYVGMTFQGYQERDYGKSAIYARKNLTIDASDLPSGINIMWDGGTTNPARVLAVYGNLTMNNVAITSGFSKYEAIVVGAQPFTLARGGGLAVWGTARLTRCVISGNRTEGDSVPARDRGSMGGGLYGNLLILDQCLIAGNWAKGYGAAGGGVYSVGGVDLPGLGSSLSRCTISGNRTTAQSSYGGGVFTEGGGPGGHNWLTLSNCTIARNLVEDHPDIPQTGGPPPPQYYYRGGGVYMTNGSLAVTSCTIAENAVTGYHATFSNKPNMGGGGIAATIGNAHVVEYVKLTHSIVAGNLVGSTADDLYTGSLLQFNSEGYNRVGKINFDYILVPIPAWWSLSRKHWPKPGDLDGVDVSQVLALGAAPKHPAVTSVGTDDGDSVVLWYPPAGDAVNQIPSYPYDVSYVLAQYTVIPGQEDDFLFRTLSKLRIDFSLGPTFGDSLGYVGVTWQGVDGTWPSKPENANWIKFWRDLDVEIGDSLGTVKLGDNFWGSFAAGPLGDNLMFYRSDITDWISLTGSDQLGHPRPNHGLGDIGAIEN
jgi:hypothetical protein